MTWIAPSVTRPNGSLTAPETELLPGLLDFHRSTLLYKCAGLSAEQLAVRAVPPSNLSLLGLVRHMAKVERIWFRSRLRGEQIGQLYVTAERPDADFEDGDPGTAEADYARLLAEQETARQAAAGVPLDTTLPGFRGVGVMSLRMLYGHMIGEYARHNGHADLIRQSVDGATGA
ncbi:MAG TPA: DinB family protein [Rugosimonospora sp.]|nr:DinB family protein [Rugosimonospora sp.]